MAKKITVDYLSGVNFKGIRSRRVDFDPEKTVVSGRNKSGKSTIADELFWLLSGKDRYMRPDTGRGSFQLKTVDEAGEVIPHLEHSVEGQLTVTETETGEVIVYKLRRTLVEEWSKAKGDGEAVLKGNTTHYFIDDVECKAGEYNDLVRSIIPEFLLGIISNPENFFKMEWQKQREILVDMAGGVSLTEAAGEDAGMLELAAMLEAKAGRTVEAYRQHLASQRKMVKAELDTIQPTIRPTSRGRARRPSRPSTSASRAIGARTRASTRRCRRRSRR